VGPAGSNASTQSGVLDSAIHRLEIEVVLKRARFQINFTLPSLFLVASITGFVSGIKTSKRAGWYLLDGQLVEIDKVVWCFSLYRALKASCQTFNYIILIVSTTTNTNYVQTRVNNNNDNE
jgi:hypothetical protein